MIKPTHLLVKLETHKLQSLFEINSQHYYTEVKYTVTKQTYSDAVEGLPKYFYYNESNKCCQLRTISSVKGDNLDQTNPYACETRNTQLKSLFEINSQHYLNGSEI